MSKITGKVNYKEVLKGDTGYTFEPHVTVDGILYWTNNGNLENPLPVNLHGKQGFVFIPHVDSEGNLSWSNTGELENPPTVNIKGDKGYFYTPHISQDGILTWSNNGDLENPQPFNISDLILNEVKESRVDTTGKTFSKLKERLDSDFKKLSESIKNNDTKDEVVQARTATTGENFMTLDDRIDHEVMRLREKIEVTMLEQEDKESHIIENTVEGVTSDMVVKGRTLQNLCSSKLVTINVGQVFNNIISPLNLLQGGKTYTIIYNLTKTSSINERCTPYLQNASGNRIYEQATVNYNISTGIKKWTITLSSDFEPTQLCFWVQGHNSDVEIKDFIIIEGDYTNKPIPTHFEGISSFGQQEDKISILSNGSNLLYNIFSVGSCSNNGNDFVKNSNKANFNENKFEYVGAVEKFTRKAVIFKHKFKPNENYTLNISSSSVGSESIWGWFLDDNLKVVSGQDPFYLKSTSGSSTILSKQSYNYFMITFPTTLYNTNLEFYNEMILTESNTVKNFKPPIYNKKDILLQNLGFDEGLKGINDVTDEINSIRKVAIKRIGKREYREGDLLLGNVITDKVNTYYVLEEPVETPLNENINVKTFNDKTYVSFENSINGTSSFKVPVNTNKLINDLKFEKEDLKEKFNNLTTEFENFKTYMIQTLPYKEV